MVKLIYTEENNQKTRIEKIRGWMTGAILCILICILEIKFSQSLFTGPFSYMNSTSAFWGGVITSIITGVLFFVIMGLAQYEKPASSQQKKFYQEYETHRMGCLDIQIEITPDCDYMCFVHHGYAIKSKLPEGFSYDLKGRGEDIIIDMNKMLIYDK